MGVILFLFISFLFLFHFVFFSSFLFSLFILFYLGGSFVLVQVKQVGGGLQSFYYKNRGRGSLYNRKCNYEKHEINNKIQSGSQHYPVGPILDREPGGVKVAGSLTKSHVHSNVLQWSLVTEVDI